MDELKETVGSFLVPALKKLADIGVTVSDFLATHPVVTKFALAGGALAAAVWGVTAAHTAWDAATKALSIAQGALNAVLEANPIILIIGGIILLGAAIYEAYQHFGPFHDAVDAAWQILQTGYNWVKDNWPLLLAILTGPIGLAVLAIVKNWDTIKHGITDVKDWIGDRIGDVVGFFTSLPGKIGHAVVGMFDGVKDAFKAAFNWLIDKWNSLHFGLPSIDTHIPGVGKIGGFDIGVPQIPRFAAGGAINGLGLVGENGPELFVGSGTIFPNGALGGTVTFQAGAIVVNAGPGMDEMALAAAVRTQVLQLMRRNINGGMG
jgi:hypothetical protein